MKKILLSLLISVLAFGIEAQAQTEKPIKFDLTLHIEIAKPKFDCEYGFGLCRLGLSVSRSVSTGVTLSGNIITFYFNRSTMSDVIAAEFTKNTAFPIDDATSLPADVWVRLGERSERTMRPGNYRIQSTPDYYIVSVPLE